jgi:hypothetical protein
MALTVSQMLAASFSEVVNEMRRPENQWAESAFLRELERQGALKGVSGAPQLEATLDYRRNEGAEFQTTDLQTVSTSKTDVLTAAVYDPAQLSVPITWSKADEAKNPTVNQKVPFVRSLIENAVNSHDDLIEEAIFEASTEGFLGLQTIVPDSGQGSVGGISAVTEAWWRNYSSTYYDDFSNIEAAMTTAFNTAQKGTGSKLKPTLIVSDAETQSGYESVLQALQRFVDTKEADAGFKVLAFKTARYVYSQYANERIYFLNPKSFQVKYFKNAFRQLGDTIELPNANGYIRKVFTLLQTITNNKSRLAVLTETAAP